MLEEIRQSLTRILTDKQSQLAVVLIGILLATAGFLTYDLIKQEPGAEKIDFGEVTTPTPAATETITEVKPAAEPTAANVYLVVAGDSLWKIARDKLGEGAKWREIAKLNQIPDDNPVVRIGQKLNLPEAGGLVRPTGEPETGLVASGAVTVAEIPKTDTTASPKTYTVVRSDTLWDIAVRFYGDGTQWHKIFDYSANRLSMYSPNGQSFPLIHAGNQLVIP